MLINVIHHSLHFLLLMLFVDRYHSETSQETQLLKVPIGVVLDVKSPFGSMIDLCMRMAVLDFYSVHRNYSTRLQLHTKNAENVVDANFAVVELLKNEEVQGIIGPQGSREETFFAELGQQFHVPIISITSTTSDISYSNNRYFVRTTFGDAVQSKALAAICHEFGWSEFAILYEDMDYGASFLSVLNEAFQEADIALAYMVAISSSANDAHIMKELNKLTTKQTRVFIVHMSPSLGYRLFRLAKRAGVMSEGYAWIVTTSLSIFMNSMDSTTRDSMEGVIGIRPYLSYSKDLDSFKERWKRNMTLSSRGDHQIMELNVYGLWAYDAVTALANAVEKSATSFQTMSSSFGPQLINELLSTELEGLSGHFELVDGKLKHTGFEIFNVIGNGEKSVGFWTPEKGIVRQMSSVASKGLKTIVWPGDSLTQPKGWSIPASGKLIVGVPWKNGYKEFVDFVVDPKTNHTNATGFSIDILLAALEALPFQLDYEFQCYNGTGNPDWTYDDMLHGIPEDFDMVVGDTTNWAPRAEYVDFSIPYSESGVILVVKNRKPIDMWIFIKPLRWDLWLAIIVTCIVMGVVLRTLEHRVSPDHPTRANEERRDSIRALIPVAALAFPERNAVTNNWSFFVLMSWLFMAFILMQSYTANLSAILTIDQLKFAFSDSYNIGYQEGSFMEKFLKQQLHINASRLKSYSSPEQYHEAMSLGTKKQGIDAIFDEIPYMKLFLNKYDSQYKMVGPTYRTGGFGFAFPKGSPLTAHFSKAILDVTQASNMTAIEQKNFGPGYSTQDPLSSTISQQTSSLTLYEFAGLFIIIGSIVLFALFCSETQIGRKLTEKTTNFIQTHFPLNTTTRVKPLEDAGSRDENDESVQNHDRNSYSSGKEDEAIDEDVVVESPQHADDEIQHIGDEFAAAQSSTTTLNGK